MGPVIISRHYMVSFVWNWHGAFYGGRYMALGYAYISEATIASNPHLSLAYWRDQAESLAQDNAIEKATQSFATEDEEWGGFADVDVQDPPMVLCIERWDID